MSVGGGIAGDGGQTDGDHEAHTGSECDSGHHRNSPSGDWVWAAN